MFLITSIAYIPIIHINRFIDLLNNIMPDSAFNTLSAIITSTVNNRSINNMIISFIIAIWSSSKAVSSLIRSMNFLYKVKETRSYFKILLISFLFTIIFLILIFSSIILLIYGELIGHFIFKLIGLDNIFFRVWNYLRYIIELLTIVIAFIILFKYTPNKKISFSEVIPGAIISTISWIIISIFYSLYANNYASYEVIYGSLSGIIILITWLYLSSWSILIGCEINSRLFLNNKK